MRQTAIQCTDKVSGRMGSFYFDDSAPMEATSPVFDSLVELYIWDEKTDLEKEVIEMIRAGMAQVSYRELVSRLDALGYKIAGGPMSFDYFNGSNKYHYPARSCHVVEKDSGLSFANIGARRDSNFQALQAMRKTVFAVSRGRLVEY